MDKVVFHSNPHHMFSADNGNVLICAIDEPDLKNQELKDSLNNDQDGNY